MESSDPLVHSKLPKSPEKDKSNLADQILGPSVENTEGEDGKNGFRAVRIGELISWKNKCCVSLKMNEFFDFELTNY